MQMNAVAFDSGTRNGHNDAPEASTSLAIEYVHAMLIGMVYSMVKSFVSGSDQTGNTGLYIAVASNMHKYCTWQATQMKLLAVQRCCW